MRFLSACFLAICLLAAVPIQAAFSSPEEQSRKALVVLVFDETCKAWCQKVRPVMADLKVQYAERVDFAELDATQSVLEASKEAKELGILGLFSDSADYVPMVLIVDNRRNLIKELPGPKTKEDYCANIEKAISHSK